MIYSDDPNDQKTRAFNEIENCKANLSDTDYEKVLRHVALSQNVIVQDHIQFKHIFCYVDDRLVGTHQLRA